MVRVSSDSLCDGARVLKNELGSRALPVVDIFCHCGEEPRHLIQNRAHQRVARGKVIEYCGNRYLGFARDFSVAGGADSATCENANRATQEQSAPLVLVERGSAATVR